jgi:hypothetical protein
MTVLETQNSMLATARYHQALTQTTAQQRPSRTCDEAPGAHQAGISLLEERCTDPLLANTMYYQAQHHQQQPSSELAGRRTCDERPVPIRLADLS